MGALWKWDSSKTGCGVEGCTGDHRFVNIGTEDEKQQSIKETNTVAEHDS
jgi:hypothetical protein